MNPFLNNIEKREVDKFLKEHPEKSFSAAGFEYGLYVTPKITETVNTFAEKFYNKSEEDLMFEKIIEQASAPDHILKLMRKNLSGLNRSALREKILEFEQELLPLIKEKAVTNRQDIFIENALYFFSSL